MKPYYTTFEVARICRVSPGSINRWIHEGKISATVTSGGHHRISREALVRFTNELGMPLSEGPRDATPVHVLIVDDENSGREMLLHYFHEHHPECEVEEASDGLMAGWKLHGLKPDLVLLDVMLPGMDGFQICRFIRGTVELKETRILTMSIMSDLAVRNKCLQMGANDFIPKPFDFDLLKEKLKKNLWAVWKQT